MLRLQLILYDENSGVPAQNQVDERIPGANMIDVQADEDGIVRVFTSITDWAGMLNLDPLTFQRSLMAAFQGMKTASVDNPSDLGASD